MLIVRPAPLLASELRIAYLHGRSRGQIHNEAKTGSIIELFVKELLLVRRQLGCAVIFLPLLQRRFGARGEHT
ncbi:hypothetical protein D3C87_2134290 [compost metagenome]